MDIDGSIESSLRALRDLLEKLIPRPDTTGTARKGEQQIEFEACERQSLTSKRRGA
jgi:hypothetical protein